MRASRRRELVYTVREEAVFMYDLHVHTLIPGSVPSYEYISECSLPQRTCAGGGYDPAITESMRSD